MKAWRLTEANKISLEETERQSVGETCIKVKLLYCSVSPTDRLMYHGKIKAEYPIVLGRQAVGMVVETGENVKNFARGDTVILKPLSACGNCNKCTESKFNDCENMLTFGVNEDGFLKDFVVVSSSDAVKLPERVCAKDAVFVDYIDMAISTIDRLNIEKGGYLVITGATQLGIIMAQAAMYYQIVPILVDINEEYLDAASRMGIYYTINSAAVDTKKKIFALTGGKMADAAAFITDSEYPFAKAIDFVKTRGSIAICGLKQSKQELLASYSPVLNQELTVCGISEGNQNNTGAINMLANKTISVAGLIKQEIGFEEVEGELQKEITPETVYFKTVVKI